MAEHPAANTAPFELSDDIFAGMSSLDALQVIFSDKH